MAYKAHRMRFDTQCLCICICIDTNIKNGIYQHCCHSYYYYAVGLKENYLRSWVTSSMILDRSFDHLEYIFSSLQDNKKLKLTVQYMWYYVTDVQRL